MPTAQLLRGVAAQALVVSSSKFTPIDLSSYFLASPADFGPRANVKGLVHLPTGAQELRGIPFRLGPAGDDRKSWLVLSTRNHSWTTRHVEVRLAQRARYLCFAQFCDWDPNEMHPADVDVLERVGQHLADAVLIFEDGREVAIPVRRRFEVNAPTIFWGHESFGSLPHRYSMPARLTDPLPHGTDWGRLQYGLTERSNSDPMLWIWALPNPEPERVIRALRLEAKSEDLLSVCGLTAFHGVESPLCYDRLKLYRVTLSEPIGAANRWTASVDLGVVARTYTLADFQPASWLVAPDAGLGGVNQPASGQAARYLYVEASVSPEATLSVRHKETGAFHQFDLGKAVPGPEIRANPGRSRVEVLEKEKVWIHGEIRDPATGGPTAARLAFRSKEGRYIPPYGHRTEINDAWFQDYGADIKVMDTSFAYVDGNFQVELPVGDVYVEITKGFEYEAVRRQIKIEPGQRDLVLEIPRHSNIRVKGYVSADTHVHFLSPSTAILEGQAEGLNLINLLAAQWGDLFTNVGDLAHGPLLSRDRETLVSIGTENRQHLLGHIGLLGGHGNPVYPMSAEGPPEGYLGEPLWSSMADWADACRRREGLAVAVHFPYPTAELAADVAMGKIDAVELYPRYGVFDSLRFNDWYRYLNCGYRLPAVGGTDKMGANMPVGANRTYAWIGQEEFNFANWAKAVRGGNTFTTTGPLLLFEADGRHPGDEIMLRSGGGTVEVKVEATSYVPFHRIEIMYNGRVIASRDAAKGTRQMLFTEKVNVPGPGWLAARCSSRLTPTTSWALAIAAHTSPIYLRAQGQDLFSPSTATYMLTLIDGAETWVRNLAVRSEQERFARVLKLFADARQTLHSRMHEHASRL